MSQIQIPSSFQNTKMAEGFGSLNPQEDLLSEGIGQSYGVITYKGKVWELRHRGKKNIIPRPDDGTASPYLDVIILNQSGHKSKSYYPVYKQGQSEGERPICSSADGIVPDLDVREKQSDTCALCPRNVLKLNAEGRKTKECKDFKRLAVLVDPKQAKLAIGEDFAEPVFLRIPPASLNPLAKMGDQMAKQGHHYSSFVTRITFNPQEAAPVMVFTPKVGLSSEEAPMIMQLRQDPLTDQIINGSVSGGMKMVEHSEPEIILPKATTSFLPPNTAKSVEAQPTKAPEAFIDAGQPEEVDTDLDAEIAKMIGRKRG